MLDILEVTDPGCCGERRLDEDGCCVGCGRDFFDPRESEGFAEAAIAKAKGVIL